jgi:Ca2+-binding EF-hand superfamily protein
VSTTPIRSDLQTPYDYDVLTKFKRLITSAGFDTRQFFNNMRSKAVGGRINKYVFRDMIKDLDLGFTHLEIEEIMNQVLMSRDGWINIDDFIKFANTPIKILNEPNANITAFISKLKQLIYKYYSTPKLAFTINDGNKNGVLDFNEYQSMICDLFRRESLKEPNFALIKNSFDFLDQRKNGVLELNEWLRAFSQVRSILDIEEGKSQKMQQLREWECSNNLQKIYNEINRNRKLLRDYAKMYLITDGEGKSSIQINNLILALKRILPRTELSQTQWKMMVRIADKQGTGMVDLDMFLKLVEQSARNSNQQPRFV